jgi:hypothetical protein
MITISEKLEAISARYALERMEITEAHLRTFLDNQWELLYIRTYFTEALQKDTTGEIERTKCILAGK